MSTYHPVITEAVARERVLDLLREAEASRRRARLPVRHRTPRRRPQWWTQGATRPPRTPTTPRPRPPNAGGG
jgi:hypothetical protein